MTAFLVLVKKYGNTSWVRAALHPLKANPYTGIAPLGPLKSIQITQKAIKINLNTSLVAQKVPQKVPQKDSAPSWAIWGKFRFLSFSKIIPPMGGVNPKKYFEVTHRGQGEVHAKFG